MKNKITLLLFASAALLMLSFTLDEVRGVCDSPVVGDHAGAPGSPSCVACHGGTENSGPGSLTLDVGSGTTTYTPGQLYNATVTVSQTDFDKFGFVITARKSNNASTGDFINPDTVNMRNFTSGGKKYFSHTPCGADATPPGSRTWNFQWQAPATNDGPVTFYMAALAANHNHALTGDFVYTQSLTLDVATGISSIDDNDISVYPTPSSNDVTVRLNDNFITERITLQNTLGQIINVPFSVATKSFTISKSDLGLQAGVYYVVLETSNQKIVKKIMFL